MIRSAPFPISVLRVPNPFFEGRNRVYVIHSDPVTVVDTGVATEKAHTELRQALQDAQIDTSRIGRIVLTHKHIDHIGGAWWLQQESGADILIHDIETASISDVDPDGVRWRSLAEERMSEWRIPESERPTGSGTGRFQWTLQPATPTAMHDGHSIDLGGAELEVIHTPGHTKGSVCLRLGRVLFSGDHVLPGISPNIGGGDLKHRGLLSDFLNSLKTCQELAPDIDEVLPGHGDPFSDLGGRCQELYEHHQQRLEQILALLRHQGPQTVHAAARAIFGKVREMHLLLACAEAQSHLDYLVDQKTATVCDGIYSAA